MLEKRIRLRAVDDVCEFVKAAERCDFNVKIASGTEGYAGEREARSGHMCTAAPAVRSYSWSDINAKSILGVMSMDLTQVLTVKYGAQDGAFEKVLQKFAAVN